MDNRGLFHVEFLHSSRKEHEDYRKGKNPPGSSSFFLFFLTPSLCSFVPPAPLGCLLGASQHLFYWLLLCVREQIVFYSQVRVEDECEGSITFFCIRLELSGMQMGLPAPLRVGAGPRVKWRVCVVVKKRELCFYVYLIAHEKANIYIDTHICAV